MVSLKQGGIAVCRLQAAACRHLAGDIMAKNKGTITALYMRLSVEDEHLGESYSIESQRMILRKAAKDYCFTNLSEYIDDGTSGTTFDRRDSLLRMLQDVEDGKISVVMVKDTSRFGRNASMVMYYVNVVFPKMEVRFMSIDRNFDSFNKSDTDDFMFGISSMFDEHYAADISRKVKSAQRVRAQAGEFLADTPYGYRRREDAKNRLRIEHDEAEVIRQIFSWTLEGHGTQQIASMLHERRAIRPGAIKNIPLRSTLRKMDDYSWNTGTLNKILSNPVYVGDTVYRRRMNRSFKDHTSITVPEEDWIVARDTHDAIVTREVFESIQKIAKVKRRPDKSGNRQIFQGLIKCADCGASLTLFRSDGKAPSFSCNTYRARAYKGVKPSCTGHQIKYDELYGVVLRKISGLIADVAKDGGEAIRKSILKQHQSASSDSIANSFKRLNTRDAEIKRTIKKLLEQNAAGVISDEMFAEMYSTYATEQKSVAASIREAEAKLTGNANVADNIKRFLAVISKYTDLTELTRELLMDLVDKIVVYEANVPYRSRCERHQKVDIYYRFIGYF